MVGSWLLSLGRKASASASLPARRRIVIRAATTCRARGEASEHLSTLHVSLLSTNAIENVMRNYRGQTARVARWWRGERNLLHECNGGYPVYDPDDVSSAVQEVFGDKRSDEIADWANGLDGYCWLDVASSNSKHDSYHCQPCDGSEWALLFNREKIARGMGSEETDVAPAPVADAPKEPYVVYVDES